VIVGDRGYRLEKIWETIKDPSVISLCLLNAEPSDLQVPRSLFQRLQELHKDPFSLLVWKSIDEENSPFESSRARQTARHRHVRLLGAIWERGHHQRQAKTISTWGCITVVYAPAPVLIILVWLHRDSSGTISLHLH